MDCGCKKSKKRKYSRERERDHQTRLKWNNIKGLLLSPKHRLVNPFFFFSFFFFFFFFLFSFSSFLHIVMYFHIYLLTSTSEDYMARAAHTLLMCYMKWNATCRLINRVRNGFNGSHFNFALYKHPALGSYFDHVRLLNGSKDTRLSHLM